MNYSNSTERTNLCDSEDRKTREIGRAFASAFIFITSLLGNALIIMVVYRERRMRTIVNLLIVNMTVSDFLCTLFVIPRVITQTFTNPQAWLITGSSGDALCKIVYFFQDVTVAVSLLSLLIIANERYFAVARPVILDTTQKTRCIILILVTWVLASIIYSVHFYTFKLEISEDEGVVCLHTWKPLIKDSFEAWKIQFLVQTIMFVFIPFAVVATLYMRIIIRVKRMSVPEDASFNGRSRRLRRNKKVLRMLLAVVIAFGVCWFPFLIYRYIVLFIWDNQNLEPPCSVELIGEFTLYLTYINSSINPAIYFMFSKNYRNGLTKIILPLLSPFFNNSRKRVSRDIETPRFKRPPKDNAGVVQCQNVELRVFPQP